jgi:hypothetical protein
VLDVECKAISRRRLQYATYVAIGYGYDRLSLHTVGLEVYTRVEVVGTHLCEVGRVVACYVA